MLERNHVFLFSRAPDFFLHFCEYSPGKLARQLGQGNRKSCWRGSVNQRMEIRLVESPGHVHCDRMAFGVMPYDCTSDGEWTRMLIVEPAFFALTPTPWSPSVSPLERLIRHSSSCCGS